MPRYIDADARKAELKEKEEFGEIGYREYIRMEYALDGAPTADVVEVVRCKDCKYCEQYADFDTDRLCNHGCGLGCLNGNSYCSYGERKDKTDEGN